MTARFSAVMLTRKRVLIPEGIGVDGLVQCVSQGDGTGIVQPEAVVREPVLFLDLRARFRRNAQAHPREISPRTRVSPEIFARFASRRLP